MVSKAKARCWRLDLAKMADVCLENPVMEYGGGGEGGP